METTENTGKLVERSEPLADLDTEKSSAITPQVAAIVNDFASDDEHKELKTLAEQVKTTEIAEKQPKQVANDSFNEADQIEAALKQLKVIRFF